jgi:hypothetical protein
VLYQILWVPGGAHDVSAPIPPHIYRDYPRSRPKSERGNDMNFKDHFVVLPALLGGVSGNWIWYRALRGLVSENGKNVYRLLRDDVENKGSSQPFALI